MDSDDGSDLFSSYEAELRLVKADLDQTLERVSELAGEQRKAAISQAQRALDEAKEIVRSSRCRMLQSTNCASFNPSARLVAA